MTRLYMSHKLHTDTFISVCVRKRGFNGRVLKRAVMTLRFVCVCSVQTFSFYVVLVLLKMSKDHKNHHSYRKHCPVKFS